MQNIINFSNTTPAAPAGGQNVKWQNDASTPPNVSAYVSVYGPDVPPASPSAYNDEFNGTSLSGIWTLDTNTVNSVSYSGTVPGSLYLTFTGNQLFQMHQAFVPGGGDINLTLAFTGGFLANYNSITLSVADTTAGLTNSIGFGVQYNTGAGNINFETQWWAASSPGNSRVTSPCQFPIKTYIRMQRVSSVWSTYFSYDGVGWATSNSNVNSSFNPTIGYIILSVNANTATNHWQAAMDWLRVNWLTLP